MVHFNVRDVNNLANAVKEHYSAKSPTAVNGTCNFIYFMPNREQDVNTILSIFTKYGIPAYPHKSSLSPIPVVRVPHTNDIAITAPNFFPLIAEINRVHRTAPAPNISAYDREMQQYQIRTLKELTGLDFKFVPADKSPYHVKSYVCTNGTTDAFNVLATNNINVIGDDTDKMIVVENQFDAERVLAAMRKQDNPGKFGNLITESIGKINGHDVYLEPFFKASIVENVGRAIVVVNINGKSLPFYVSSGQAGKDKIGIPSGHWYPIMGIGENWFNKMPDMMHNPYPELDQVVDLLEKRFPAATLKQIALANETTHQLRRVDKDELMRVVNKDFPEGVQHRYNQHVYEYAKNVDVYLPAIIRAWRAPATGYLKTYGNAISRPIDNLIQKIQKRLHAEIIETDGVIQFVLNENTSQYLIRDKLEKMGFEIGQNLTISADDLMNQYLFRKRQAAREFATGQREVKKKSIWSKMRDKLATFMAR